MEVTTAEDTGARGDGIVGAGAIFCGGGSTGDVAAGKVFPVATTFDTVAEGVAVESLLVLLVAGAASPEGAPVGRFAATIAFGSAPARIETQTTTLRNIITPSASRP
jgi:hypothetical protein